MRKSVYVAVVLLLALLAGCDPKASEVDDPQLPEVNDENCLPENIAKITPSDAREQFRSMCFRRGSFKPSEQKEW